MQFIWGKCSLFGIIFLHSYNILIILVRWRLSLWICSDKLKTQSSFRSFPLHPEVEQLLRQRQPRRPSGPVMTARYGLPLHPERLGAQFRQFLREHDLRHIRFHDLRHTCATSLAQRGCETTDIQAYMGHSNPITTSRYIHPEISENARSLQRLEQALACVS